MLINSDHEAVKRLCETWKKYKGNSPYLRELRSKDHARALRKILDEALLPFQGELILVYQTFLSSRPSGAHSFAHGSEMVSQTVYWVTVARIAEAKATYEKEGSRSMGIGQERIRIGFASKYLVQVSMKKSLRPRYRGGKHEPYFVLPDASNESEAPEKMSLDIAVLGQHLFRVQPHKNDWYTKVEIAFGNASVEEWLKVHDSAEVIPMLHKL